MRKLQAMRDSLRLCRRLSPDIRASQIDMLATVALRPGLSQRELAEECDLTTGAISRAVDVFGSRGRKDGVSGALGLLMVLPDETDDRIKRVYLTTSGQQFVDALNLALEQLP